MNHAMNIFDSRLAKDLQNHFDSNVFIMMRYRHGRQFKNLENALTSALARYGLFGRFAKDSAFSDDLWENVQFYMRFSRFGIAVFEEIDERDFNPNISLELGFMYALNRRCLLLKDKHIPRLPTDTSGKIYRDFDIADLSNSIETQIGAWCERDLGLSLTEGYRHPKHERELLVYDTEAEDSVFRTWGKYSTIGMFSRNIQMIEDYNKRLQRNIPVMQIATEGTEGAGINKAISTLFGKAKFEYKAIKSDASILNLYFCMIPMQGEPSQLLEVGAERRSDPANAYSPYRVRFYVPHNQIGDGEWHSAEIAFDFRTVPTASYCIVAVRINEGCPKPGAGMLFVTNVRVISYLLS
jgi:hypothetical protein